MQGIKSFGVRFPIILKLFQFVTLESMTYVTSNVKASFMLLIPFVAVVAPCDLWLVITYASTIRNDVL
jgi:hypothetical protein